jgi:hypothetical protein
MSSYSMNAASIAPITAGQISQIDLGAYSFGERKNYPIKKYQLMYILHTVAM